MSERENKDCSLADGPSLGDQNVPILGIPKIEFSSVFFEGVDEAYAEWRAMNGGRLPDWEIAVARAKLEGVVPLGGSGDRVMATIPRCGVVVADCLDCIFRIKACLCSQSKEDVCGHPEERGHLVLGNEPEPPKECPLRKATCRVVLARKYCDDSAA